LVERCELRTGTAVFEVGAGTGLATRRLLELGATLHAIEPNPKSAALLRQSISASTLQIEEMPFEDIDLPQAHFDLGVAATSFHWVEQAIGLTKAYGALKSGGWWAMWWTHFGPGEEYDAFQAATNHLFINTCDGPSQGRNGRPPFALDYDARVHDIVATGFRNADVDLWRWTLPYNLNPA
jgi:SAM-dependent methyltransferase